MSEFECFSLCQKSDGREVYTSPAFKREDCPEVLDLERVSKTLRFYIDRVNSGRNGKPDMKMLEKNDFIVKFMRVWNEGGWSKRVFWSKDGSEVL